MTDNFPARVAALPNSEKLLLIDTTPGVVAMRAHVPEWLVENSAKSGLITRIGGHAWKLTEAGEAAREALLAR